MTKELFIETCFIALSGGKLSADNNIRREDISAYLPVAINAVALEDFYERRNLSRGEDNPFLQREDIGAESFSKFTFTPETDGQLNYITIPKPSNIPFGRAFDMVYCDMDNPFIRIKSPIEIAGLPLGYSVYFWHEGERLYIKNLTCADCDVTIRMSVSPESLANDAELPIPSGKEEAAIKKVLMFFGVQLSMPTNLINDNHEDVQQHR